MRSWTLKMLVVVGLAGAGMGCSSSSEQPAASADSATATDGGVDGNGAGPQTPPCGLAAVETNEVIAGVQFSKGQYQINTFGMACDEVMGESGIFNQFLQLGDNEPLPAPWSHLSNAVGAPKFVKGPGIGFRAERVGD